MCVGQALRVGLRWFIVRMQNADKFLKFSVTACRKDTTACCTGMRYLHKRLHILRDCMQRETSQTIGCQQEVRSKRIAEVICSRDPENRASFGIAYI